METCFLTLNQTSPVLLLFRTLSTIATIGLLFLCITHLFYLDKYLSLSLKESVKTITTSLNKDLYVLLLVFIFITYILFNI